MAGYNKKKTIEELQAKIHDITNDVKLCETVAQLDENECWQTFKSKIEERIQEQKDMIFKFNTESWDKESSIVRDKIQEIQIIEEILELPSKFSKVSETQTGILNRFIEKLKQVKLKKVGAQKVAY